MGGNLARLMNVEDKVLCGDPPGAARRHGAASRRPGRRRRRRSSPHLRRARRRLATLRRRARRVGRAGAATAWPSGRRTAPSGSSPCSASGGPAPRSSRSTRASRGARPPTSSPAAGPRRCVTVTDFLDTDYWAMLQDSRRSTCPTSTTVVIAKGPAADGTVGWDDFLDAGHRRSRRRGGRAHRLRSRADDPSRHPLHLRHHGRAQGRRDDPRPHPAGGHRLGGHDRAPSRTTAT